MSPCSVLWTGGGRGGGCVVLFSLCGTCVVCFYNSFSRQMPDGGGKLCKHGGECVMGVRVYSV